MPWTQKQIFVGSCITKIDPNTFERHVQWGVNNVGRPPYVTKAERRQLYLEKQASIKAVKEKYSPEAKAPVLVHHAPCDQVRYPGETEGHKGANQPKAAA